MGHKPFVQTRSTHRPERYAQRLKEELSRMLPGKLKDPRLAGVGFITITGVEVTPDLKHGAITFSLMSDTNRAGDVEDALNQASNFLRRELMRILETKITPHLIFRFDKGLDTSAHMNSLLNKISKPETDSANSDSSDSSDSDDSEF